MDQTYREDPCNNLQEVIKSAAENPSQHWIGYVNPEGKVMRQSYAMLYENALDILAQMHGKGMQKGDYLIIAAESNYEILNYLWAAILGGIIPTVLQPPVGFLVQNPAAEKLIKVYKLLDSPWVYLPKGIHDNTPGIDPKRIINGTEQSAKTGKARVCCSEPGDIAYLQFSSGSTGDPKGIILSHKNIIINIDAISEALRFTPDDTTCNWMPLYHDMGLIGYHFTPIYLTHNQLHIETTDFIKDPYLWLRILSEERVNITGCPNFGQALINRHIKRKPLPALDLSALRGILNGAEPISPEIMENFMENLLPHGLAPGAMMPVYGMAEATLAITFSELGEKPVIRSFNPTRLSGEGRAIPENDHTVPVHRIVNVGRPLRGITLTIRNKKGDRLEEGEVGEICIQGETLFRGYFSTSAETKAEGEPGGFRTGDQGFLFEGALYITGRYKDIIFIHGKNYYANDLEAYAIRECDLVYGKFIIGGYPDRAKGRDSIIAFLAGSDNENTRIKFEQIAALFSRNMGIHIDHFVVIKSNQIHKTSSGKIKRYRIIQDFLEGRHHEIQL
ncbi:MAG: AMP-binding protein [Bacteroidales bacterium]|nr:AMP-binding protein [Bacteroidales bacterium]MDY0285685.1 AMP-binding protein [Bacteroidales bacterium]